MESEICLKCGTVMICKTGSTSDIYTCPTCGWTMYEEYYEGFEDCDEGVEYPEDYIPAGCSACGGPYPLCKTSCKLFDL